MDCHDFKKNHLAFVDDTLPGVDMVAMQRHLLECQSCARHDSRIRRSLRLAHDLAPIEPSPDFSTRLWERLRHVKPMERGQWRYDGPRSGAFLTGAAAVVTIGMVLASTLDWTEPVRDLRLMPVVATMPALSTSPITSPAIMASVSTGMSAWPAVLMAEQAPMHFANAEFQLASWQSGR